VEQVSDVLEIDNTKRKPISAEDRAKMAGQFPYYGPTQAQGWIDHYTYDGRYCLIGEDGDHFLKYRTLSMTQLVDGKFNVNNHAHAIKGTKACEADWFYYCFQNRDLGQHLTRQGAKRYKLTKASLEKIPLLVPPITERAKIISILSTWDRAIETLEALIANARAQKRAMMQSLPTGKKRLPGFSGTWARAAIGDVAVEVSERAGDQIDMPVLSCSKHDGIVLSLTYFKKKVYSDDISNYKVMRRGAFGFPSNHVEEGSIGYQDICDAGIVSPIYCVFRSNGSIDDSFLYKLLKTDRCRQIFAAATNASVDRRGSLRWKEFSKIEIPLPPFEEQKAISEAIDAADGGERAYARQLTALKKEKSALMQQLLTGKRRVKVDEREAT